MHPNLSLDELIAKANYFSTPSTPILSPNSISTILQEISTPPEQKCSPLPSPDIRGHGQVPLSLPSPSTKDEFCIICGRDRHRALTCPNSPLTSSATSSSTTSSSATLFATSTSATSQYPYAS